MGLHGGGGSCSSGGRSSAQLLLHITPFCFCDTRPSLLTRSRERTRPGRFRSGSAQTRCGALRVHVSVRVERGVSSMLERSHVGRQPCALHRGQASVTTKMASYEEIAREMEQETRD